MAKQTGPFKITGTTQNICFYKMEGQYYARQKSSLTGKRVKKDPAFAETMRHAELLGKASTLASFIKRSFPKEGQCRELFRLLTGKVMRLMKEGVGEEEIKGKLSFVLKKKEKKVRSNIVVKKRSFSGYRPVFKMPVYNSCYRQKRMVCNSS